MNMEDEADGSNKAVEDGSNEDGSNNKKKDKKKDNDPNDWGDDTVKLPGMISLSKLELMLPNKGGPKPPRDWEADSNQRQDWRLSVDNLNPSGWEDSAPVDAAVAATTTGVGAINIGHGGGL
jgi:hypothetical protein